MPCKYGFVGVHDPATLAAWTGSSGIIQRLLAVPGVRVHQRGDGEVRVLFGLDQLDAVAELLQPRKRRRTVLNEEQRMAKSERMKSLLIERVNAARSPA
jgi:hypothetical protein